MSKYLDNDGLLYFWQKIKTLLAGKVDTVSGKGLSTNDFTTAEKNKLAGIAEGANNYTYTLPTASATVKGGVKIGSGLTMTGEVLSADEFFIPEMSAASSSAAGSGGSVPVPDAGSQNKFLRGDATWSNDGSSLVSLNASNLASGTVPAARLPNASASTKGAMSSSDYSKLAALPTNATLESTYAKKTDITSMYKHKGSVATVADLPASATAGDVYNVTATGMNYVWVDSTTGWDALGEVFSIDAITNSEIDTILAS